MLVVMGSMPPPQKTAISDQQNPKTGKPRSLLSTLIESAKGAGPEAEAAVTTPSISKPQATTSTEAAVRTSTLLYTFHDCVLAFFASDDYAPIRE